MSTKGQRVPFPKEPGTVTHRPILINLWAACGVGKSRTMAGVFNVLKFKGLNAEMAPEAAKALTYEKRWDALRDQLFVEGLQSQTEARLIGNVDYIVTDAPAGIGAIYTTDAALREIVLDAAQVRRAKFRCFDVRLVRDDSRPYEEWGRTQNEKESRELDQELDRIIGRTAIVMDMKVPATFDAPVTIAHEVLRRSTNGTL